LISQQLSRHGADLTVYLAVLQFVPSSLRNWIYDIVPATG
jgi:hypothetical protein